MPKAHSLLAVLSLLTASLCQAQTGTFVDKWGANDLRVVSYNIFNDAIFPPSDDPFNDVPERFRRVVNALQPDVLAVQEIRDFTASETAALLDSVAPLPGGANWHAHKNSDNVILSRFPFLLTTSQAGHADALIDLPDADYAQDFFVLNDHLPCCSNEVDRQFEADRIVRWIDDARSPGGSITLPDETPFVLLGDFNIVGSGQPLDTLVTGDIINTFIGPDSPPDWDGTPLTDSRPLHNASGPNDYTWRNDTSRFPPGRLDYILYSDSVVETANSFVLNTTILSASERLATGLQSNDVLINAGSGFFDHLPVVVDFRLAAPIAGDYNADGTVDELDYTAWQNTFGQAVSPGTSADGNNDGLIDAADYTVWRDAQSAPAAAVPEPISLLLASFAASTTLRCRRATTST